VVITATEAAIIILPSAYPAPQGLPEAGRLIPPQNPKALLQSKTDSLGLSPFSVYGIEESASLPDLPSLARSDLSLSQTLAGLLLLEPCDLISCHSRSWAFRLRVNPANKNRSSH